MGPMGAGKSSVGRRVARRLGVTFIDTDSRIQSAHGAITEIFATHGERRFREWERETVAGALAENAVVALGGGSILNADTRRDLLGHTVILLTISPESFARRVDTSKRPLLHGDPDAWARIRDERMPIYEELATVTFDTSDIPLDGVADAIVAWLRKDDR
jgi:shikimate kinase